MLLHPVVARSAASCFTVRAKDGRTPCTCPRITWPSGVQANLSTLVPEASVLSLPTAQVRYGRGEKVKVMLVQDRRDYVPIGGGA